MYHSTLNKLCKPIFIFLLFSNWAFGTIVDEERWIGASYKFSDYYIVRKKTKYGLITKQGEEILSPCYNKMVSRDNFLVCEEVYDEKYSKFTIFNHKLDKLIDSKKGVRVASCGSSCIEFEQSEGKSLFVTIDGNVSLVNICSDSKTVKKYYSTDGPTNLKGLRVDGKLMTNYLYEDIIKLNRNVFLVRMAGKYGLIGKDGQIYSKCLFDDYQTIEKKDIEYQLRPDCSPFSGSPKILLYSHDNKKFTSFLLFDLKQNRRINLPDFLCENRYPKSFFFHGFCAAIYYGYMPHYNETVSKWGVFDFTGNKLVKYGYSSLGPFNCRLGYFLLFINLNTESYGEKIDNVDFELIDIKENKVVTSTNKIRHKFFTLLKKRIDLDVKVEFGDFGDDIIEFGYYCKRLKFNINGIGSAYLNEQGDILFTSTESNPFYGTSFSHDIAVIHNLHFKTGEPKWSKIVDEDGNIIVTFLNKRVSNVGDKYVILQDINTKQYGVYNRQAKLFSEFKFSSINPALVVNEFIFLPHAETGKLALFNSNFKRLTDFVYDKEIMPNYNWEIKDYRYSYYFPY